MTRCIQSLLRLSLTLRSLSAVKSCGSPLRLLHSSSVLERRFTRTRDPNYAEEPQFELPQKVFETSEPHESSEIHAKPGNINYKLRACRTPDDIFRVVNDRIDEMTGFHALKCLEHLFMMQKENTDSRNFRELSNRNEFSQICDTLKKHIRHLNLNQTIDALKYLTYMRIPASTVITQMLLQMIRNQVNQLLPDQIIFLNFILKKCQRTPLVEALCIALPMVFETHIATKLNTGSINSLINSLQYLKQAEMPSDVIPKILKILEKKIDLTPEQAKQLLFSLVNLNADDHIINLLKLSFEICSANMEAFNEEELSVILYKLCKKIPTKIKGENIYYHEAFFDAAAVTVISRDLGFTVAIRVLDCLNDLDHINIAILDYIAAKCFENRKILQEANKHEISNIIYALSQADYKPVFWDTMRESLLNDKCLDSNPMKLTKLALYLATLDCYWPKLLSNVFSTFKIFTDKSFNSKKRLLLLYHTVKNNYPEYNGPWPSEELLQSCRDITMPEKSQYTLKSAIETVLGGPQYIMTNMRTKLAYYIDHVVVMRKGGYPVAINNPGENQVTNIEELNPLPDSQVLMFMYLPTYAYARNVERLTGYWSLIVKQIEIETKHTIIPIHASKWKSMLEPEQTRYISQAIKLKCNERTAIVN